MDVMMIMLMGKITKNNAYIDSVNEDDDDHDDDDTNNRTIFMNMTYL